MKVLLSHEIPTGDLAAVLHEAIRCGIEKHGKRRGAVAPARKRQRVSALEAAPGERSRNIPAELQRQVWERDVGRCTYEAAARDTIRSMSSDTFPDAYVHGYSEREHARLLDQATTLVDLLHHDTRYPPAARVLEAGCGVGAQTITLARNSPEARFTCVDLSPRSLEAARARARAASLENVVFRQADIFELPFPEESFDHVFVCFVLEHLPRPQEALTSLRSRLKSGGTLTVIEGDHGSTFFHPDDPDARRAIDCLVTLQARTGGDALIGRRLFPLLAQARLRRVSVSPRMVYVDSSRPEWVEGFTRNTFTAMVEGVREQALAAGLIDPEAWARAIAGLRRAAEPDGVFCYTFFKGVGVR